MKSIDTKFVESVRHLYLPMLNSISNTKSHGLRQWLFEDNAFLVNADAKNDYFSIDLYDMLDVLAAIANDINRFACASLELTRNLRPSHINKKFIAWNSVSCYYSAFFSAHCLLRILGFGLVQIDDMTANSLKKKADLYGIVIPKVNTGIYCISLNNRTNQAFFYKVSKYDDSHKGLWARFSDLLNILMGVYVSNGTYDSQCVRKRVGREQCPQSIFENMQKVDALEIFDLLDSIKTTLNKHGNGNWLSSTRNLVNYSNGFGVWYPYRSYKKEYDKIDNLYNACYFSPINSVFNGNSDVDFVSFIKTCQQINSMNYSILNDLYKRHPNNKSFLKNGAYAFDKINGALVFD